MVAVYRPISGTVPQYSKDGDEIASGYYLKGYSSGTTTPLSMATSQAAGTLLAKCLLNTSGYPLSNAADDTSVFVPYFNEEYKLALYTNESDADNNVNPAWIVDALPLASDATIPSVLQLGVTGDGTTDDTDAFEAAIAAGPVYVPAATYILDTVSLPNDTQIYADKNAIFKLAAGSVTKVIFNSSATGVLIEGGQFDNNEVVNSVSVQFTGTDLKVERCHFLGGTGAQIAISLNGAAEQVEIHKNKFSDCRFCVLTGGTTSTTKDVWVHHNYAENTTGDFVEINCPSGTARRWDVSHNIADTGGRDSIGTGFAVGSSGGTGYIDGLTIAHNHFRDWDNHTIHIEDGSRNVTIHGNHIYGAGANSTAAITTPVGIYVAGTEASNRQLSNITISENKIIGLGDMLHGIFYAGNFDITNVICSDNTVDTYDGYGIYLSSLIKQGAVDNNAARNGTGSASGIRVDGTNLTLSNNRASDNAGYGLDIIGGDNIQFIKNQLKNNTTGRVNNIATGTDMDWSLQSEAVSSNRTITGTTNNLDPLDEGVITVTTASTTPQLTGILAKPNASLYIYNNTGAASFDVMHENAGSDAANRFVTNTGANITLATGELLHFKYIGSRWRQPE